MSLVYRAKGEKPTANEFLEHRRNLRVLQASESQRHHPDLVSHFSASTFFKILELFLIVKVLLYTLVYFTPYLYDTSSSTISLLFSSDGSDTIFGARLGHLIRRLAIWDHVFFISSAATEVLHPDISTLSPLVPFLYEHEWAFGYAWIAIIKTFGTRFYNLTGKQGDPLYYFSAVAIIISTLCHFFACLALYFLTFIVYSSPQKPLLLRIYDFASGVCSDETTSDEDQEQEEASKQRRVFLKGTSLARHADSIALKTALLYTLSPAGIFLAAGYSESVFAFLSFLALINRETNQPLTAALLFSFTAIIRSNGLLWGIVYIYDAVTILRSFYYTFYRPDMPIANLKKNSPYQSKAVLSAKRNWYAIPLQKHFSRVCGGGMVLAVCFSGVQYIAYRAFCVDGPENGAPPAKWCKPSDPSRGLLHVPLIYSYIQAKYWGIGFLKYWTSNNIGNFLFAVPTLILILASTIYYYRQNERYWRISISRTGRAPVIPKTAPLNKLKKKKKGKTVSHQPDRKPLQNTALTYAPYLMTPYLLVAGTLAISAVFVWHVQIITRVASCLPTIYWYTAELLSSTRVRDVKIGKLIVRYFVIWIVVQGIFFAAFLPPA
ncbi:uncharacterized protein SAPINGB_P006064 [Magnusiomyces paraingens]|uniref:GPI mannosyltransferase 2 n=1 Tax=Magnusiomyces paraingens TaxID=2606893 RepID=A0A5E8C320_9ASCO|nr:uncharacterized protein SAPINGB_P006064 [Saprochaete ingens]VVT58154.1 unnamed protein product [Saprochaete ingens]